MFEAFEWLNGFLEGNDYVAGSTVTIADLFAVSSMLSIVVRFSVHSLSVFQKRMSLLAH